VKTLLCLLLVALSAPLSAATMRCDRDLVGPGDRSSEVLDKCGKPDRREVVGYRQRGDSGGGIDEVRIEEWTYGPRDGMYYFLRFEGNRLETIDSDREY